MVYHISNLLFQQYPNAPFFDQLSLQVAPHNVKLPEFLRPSGIVTMEQVSMCIIEYIEGLVQTAIFFLLFSSGWKRCEFMIPFTNYPFILANHSCNTRYLKLVGCFEGISSSLTI